MSFSSNLINILLILFFSFFISHLTVAQYSFETSAFNFVPQAREIGCMKQFDPFAPANNLINAYLLAKFSEAMYPERLDLQIRMNQNNGNIPLELSSTDELKKSPRISNANFQNAFQMRFAHFFEDNSNKNGVQWKFLERSNLDTTGVLTGRIVHGQDPECILVNTEKYVLIIFRGTDDVNHNKFAEWIGTDFNIFKTKTDQFLGNSRVHRGFYKSYKLIEEELMDNLKILGTLEKKIWLAGHSLGGAMATLSGIRLKQSGYDVAGVLSFGGPSVIGNSKFSQFTDSILNKKIQRFEYFLDPVSILRSPGYATFGQRNWFDEATLGKYQLYLNCPERRFKQDHNIVKIISNKRLRRHLLSSRFGKLPWELYYHNTQWLVKGLYFSVPNEFKENLPLPEDTFPFIYYAWDKGK